MSAYTAIPKESRALLESASRMHQMDRSEITTDELVLMVYNLGRIDGRTQQLDMSDSVRALLLEVSEFLERHIDVSDGDDGPQPNKAMLLKRDADEEIGRLSHG